MNLRPKNNFAMSESKSAINYSVARCVENLLSLSGMQLLNETDCQ